MVKKRRYATDGEIVRIHRAAIGDSVSGLILQESDKLLLLWRFVDFQPECLMVLDKADISRISRDPVKAFQTRLLRKQGVLGGSKRFADYDLRSWRHFFRHLRRQKHPLGCHLIVEAERGRKSRFYQGVLTKAKRRGLKLHEFSGTARWYQKPTKIKYRDVSNCQIGSHYQQVYADYLAGRL